VADQEWVVVKSRVERELATALARLAADTGRSVSALIRIVLLNHPGVRLKLDERS